MKNIDKWKQYKAIIEERTVKYLDSVCPFLPEAYYILNHRGDVLKYIITGIYYAYDFNIFFSGKMPSKNDIKKLEDAVKNGIDYDIKKVYLSYVVYYEDYHARGGTSFNDFYTSDKNYHTLDDANKASLNKKEEFNKLKTFNETHKKDANYDYKSNGYKFLGWQNGWKHVYFDSDGNETTDDSKKRSFGYTERDYPEYKNCINSNHMRIEVQHNQRGSENTVSCPICKLYWKYDSSD